MEKVKYTRTEYRTEYLKSEEWKTLRNIIMDSKPDCQCCGGKATDVHHMVYRNIVDITINDLIPVCRDCHDYIHQAIEDGYISQEPKHFKDIKDKTLSIINDDEYKKYHNWLVKKHLLSLDEIIKITNLQVFIIKKIGGLIKRSIWYDDLKNIKFTGKQIIKIRELIKVGQYRRNKKIDYVGKRSGFLIVRPKREKDFSLKNMKGFKSSKGINKDIDIN